MDFKFFWVILLNIGYLCLILGLTTRSRLLRSSIFLPLSLFFFSYVAFVDSYNYSTPLDRLRPSSAGLVAIFQTVQFLLCFDDPHVDLRRDADKNINISEQPFLRRMQWAAALCAFHRGAGWNWRVSGIPPSPQPFKPKSRFIASSLLQFFLSYLALDLLSLIFAALGSHTTIVGPLVIIHGIVFYVCLDLGYHLGCFIWVAAGFGGVEECPPLFGGWHHMSSLRGFWGRVWHQGFRGPVTIIPNRFLALFGLPPDKTGIIAFLMTGAYHALNLHAMTSGAHYHKTFLFFMLQPLGFFIEEYILRIGPFTRRQPYKANEYAWTLTYLTVTSRLYFSELVESEFYEDARWGGDGWLPLKVLRRVFG